MIEQPGIPLINEKGQAPAILGTVDEPEWHDSTMIIEQIGEAAFVGEVQKAFERLLTRYDQEVLIELPRNRVANQIGDPRNLLFSQGNYIAYMDTPAGAGIGIFTEAELDFAQAGDSIALFSDIVPEPVFKERVAYWTAKLAGLADKYPHTHFFLAHGETTHNGVLSLCGFTLLLNGKLPSGAKIAPDDQLLLVSPYHSDDNADLTTCTKLKELSQDLPDLTFEDEAA